MINFIFLAIFLVINLIFWLFDYWFNGFHYLTSYKNDWLMIVYFLTHWQVIELNFSTIWLVVNWLFWLIDYWLLIKYIYIFSNYLTFQCRVWLFVLSRVFFSFLFTYVWKILMILYDFNRICQFYVHYTFIPDTRMSACWFRIFD